MLQSLHVKNLALIDETEVEFKPGLNILSGETGAGKSIIIGSISLALGEKVPSHPPWWNWYLWWKMHPQGRRWKSCLWSRRMTL